MGNISEDNLDLIESECLNLHYVGGLKKNQIQKLSDVHKDNYVKERANNSV